MAIYFLLILFLHLADRWFLQKSYGTKARIQSVRFDFTRIHLHLEDYTSKGNDYPANEQGLSVLVERATTTPESEDWVPVLAEIPLDPWRTPYRYRFPGGKNPDEPEIISAGPDRWFGTEGDLSSQDE